MTRSGPRFVHLLAVAAAAALLALPLLSAQGPGANQFKRVGRPVPGRYVVLLRDGVPAARVADEASDLARQHGGAPRKVFPGFRMFSANMSEAAALALSRNPNVEFVEEAAVVSADAIQPINVWDEQLLIWQPWGLDRIDQRSYPGDLSFTYSGSLKNVAVYIIDSGVRPNHYEFMWNGFSRAIVRDFRGENGIDCSGHGTHVAGTVAGRTFGILKYTTFESLRVLDCNGDGTSDDIIDGVYHVTFSGQRPAVVNMSLGTKNGPSAAIDYAVRRSIVESGAVYVVSAGNGNIDAVNVSPARVAEAIVVGNSNRFDNRHVATATDGSNFGSYLDLFAPGTTIRSASPFGDGFQHTIMTGTSMAAPHVTGVVGLFLNGHRDWSPASVQNYLVANTTPDVVGNIGAGSPNRMLYSGFVNDAAEMFVSIPDKMAPGRQYTASVTLVNTGVKAWENFAAGQKDYWLGILSTHWGTQWVRQPFPSRARPEEMLTFNFTVTAPSTPGAYPFQWQMLENQADWFGPKPTRTITVAALADDAQFVAQSVPDRMVPGRQYQVSVRMRNVGTTTWTPSGYQLRAQSPDGNSNWGVSGVNVPFDGGGTPPGGEATFNFIVTAPGVETPFQWRMSKSSAGFGDFSPSVPVRLGAWPDDAEFVSMHAPAKVRPGLTYWISLTFRNRGASTWVRSLFGPPAAGTGVALTGSAFGVPMEFSLPRPSVAPGEYVTFTFQVTAPANATGGQHFEWHLISLDCAMCPEEQTLHYKAFGSSSPDLTAQVGNWPDEAAFVSYSVPSPMIPGQTYPVSVTMENRGTTTWTAAEDYWLGSLEGVTEFRNFNQVLPVPSVAPGQRATFTFNVTAPTTPGTYRMGWQMVYAGPAERPVSRYFGSNAPVAIMTVAPGTVPANINVNVANTPVSWAINTVQRISWTHNLGANSYVNVDYSRDGGLTWVPIAPVLQNTAATSGFYDWFITPDYPEGGPATTNGRVRVSWIDGPMSDVNNAAIVVSTTISPATGRDLVVSALTDPPSTVVPGATLPMTDTTRNQGTVDAGSSITRFYLSSDAIKSPADLLLSPGRAVPGLVSGAGSTGTVTLSIPSTAAPGTYHVLACADDKTDVAESNEVNNCRASGGVITVQLPDLVVTAVTHPGAVAPGASLTITDTVRNSGPAPAGASTTRYFASADATRDAADTLLSGSRSVTSLAPGASSSGSKSVTIPATLPLGTYRILACADDLLKVRETTETNNCAASATSLTVALPDLVTTSVTASAASASPGSKISLTDTIVNQGGAVAASTTTAYYLSTDSVKDAGDVALTGTRSVTSLLAGASSTGTKSVTVPSTVAEGTYRLIACGDALARVTEASETNNCMTAAATVLIGRPDLVVTAVSNPPASVVAGGQFTATDTVQNVGNLVAGSSTTRYYLSATPVKGSSAVLLAGTRSVSSLQPNASSAGSKSLTVVLGTALGTYYLVACGDDLLKVAERIETNNCRTATGTVLIR